MIPDWVGEKLVELLAERKMETDKAIDALKAAS